MKGKVEIYKNSTLSNTFLPEDNLSSIQIERTPNHGTFFGYTICQKATVKLIDKDNSIEVSNGDDLKIYLGTETEYAGNPIFTVNEITRDEVKRTINIVAYDLIGDAANYTQSELTIAYPITLSGYADIVANFLGTTVKWDNVSFVDISFDGTTNIPNFGGTETLREVLNGIAAASGSICFINNDNKICFKQLKASSPIAAIDKSLYFDLTVGEPLTLTKLTSATELGDNITAGTAEGFNQIIRDNPFLVNHTDLADTLTQLFIILNGITYYPYNIKWRGNPAFEIGDYISIAKKDETINMYYLGETISYTGGLKATSEWQTAEQGEIHSNPATIGEKLSQTVAKVDKVNKEIQLAIQDIDGYTERINKIEMDTEGIAATVSKVEQDVADLSTSIGMTPEDVQIQINQSLANGVDKVITTTGFTFNSDGLTVSKDESEMTTQITEDGMVVNRSGEAMLTANNNGVDAVNLHATTYLIIGENSRFEDYESDGEPRTGCFWIGG